MNSLRDRLPLERIGAGGTDAGQGPAPAGGESVPHPEVGMPQVSQAPVQLPRWDLIQAKFVDDPRQAVAEAHQLVRDLTEQLTRALETERAEIDQRWAASPGVSTEELRQCLQQYRSVFGRLSWATPQSQPGVAGRSNGVQPEGDTLEDSARA